jgi:uncharacterized membrane protein YbhN (UPF0104 family)
LLVVLVVVLAELVLRLVGISAAEMVETVAQVHRTTLAAVVVLVVIPVVVEMVGQVDLA